MNKVCDPNQSQNKKSNAIARKQSASNSIAIASIKENFAQKIAIVPNVSIHSLIKKNETKS